MIYSDGFAILVCVSVGGRLELSANYNWKSKRWLGKFGQLDKWSICLTVARMAAEQERL